MNDVEVKQKVENQNWAVINLLGPGLRAHCSESGVRLLGVFKKEERAQAYAKEYRDLDPLFDTYVVEMYKFWPILNEQHDVGNVHYSDSSLQELMDANVKSSMEAEKFTQNIQNAQKEGKTWAQLN